MINQHEVQPGQLDPPYDCPYLALDEERGLSLSVVWRPNVEVQEAVTVTVRGALKWRTDEKEGELIEFDQDDEDGDEWTWQRSARPPCGELRLEDGRTFMVKSWKVYCDGPREQVLGDTSRVEGTRNGFSTIGVTAELYLMKQEES